jgi:hypothetical protein
VRGRLAAWLHAWLIALDQLAYVWLAGFKFVSEGGPTPSPYETISSKTGRMAEKGHRWALVAQVLIDGLFRLLGSPPGHCRRSIIRASTISASLAAAGVPLDGVS